MKKTGLISQVSGKTSLLIDLKGFTQKGLITYLLIQCNSGHMGQNIQEWTIMNGRSKICGRQPLKNLKGYGLFKQTISLPIF